MYICTSAYAYTKSHISIHRIYMCVCIYIYIHVPIFFVFTVRLIGGGKYYVCMYVCMCMHAMFLLSWAARCAHIDDGDWFTWPIEVRMSLPLVCQMVADEPHPLLHGWANPQTWWLKCMSALHGHGAMCSCLCLCLVASLFGPGHLLAARSCTWQCGAVSRTFTLRK